MVGVHELNAQEIAAVLTGVSEEVDSDGSLMSVVQRTIIEVRSIFNGLGESMLPGLIDGEKRNVELYDEALKADAVPPAIEKMLADQRGRIQEPTPPACRSPPTRSRARPSAIQPARS